MIIRYLDPWGFIRPPSLPPVCMAIKPKGVAPKRLKVIRAALAREAGRNEHGSTDSHGLKLTLNPKP